MPDLDPAPRGADPWSARVLQDPFRSRGSNSYQPRQAGQGAGRGPGGPPHEKLSGAAENLLREVESREVRMVRRQREGPPNLWRSAAMVGLVGWSVAVPTLAGVALGAWIDRHWPGRFSWTLMLLFAGLVLGCWSAWRRIAQEQENH